MPALYRLYFVERVYKQQCHLLQIVLEWLADEVLTLRVIVLQALARECSRVHAVAINALHLLHPSCTCHTYVVLLCCFILGTQVVTGAEVVTEQKEGQLPVWCLVTLHCKQVACVDFNLLIVLVGEHCHMNVNMLDWCG